MIGYWTVVGFKPVPGMTLESSTAPASPTRFRFLQERW